MVCAASAERDGFGGVGACDEGAVGVDAALCEDYGVDGGLR